jgi:hypothetical protein
LAGQKNLVRNLRKYGVVLAVLYAALMGGLLAVMRQPILFGRVMRHVPEPLMMVVPFKPLWFVARAGRLRIGDAAPNFDLPGGDKSGRVVLASFRGHEPVVLVFGSYT